MNLEEIKKAAIKEVQEVISLLGIQNLKAKYLGKSGFITEQLKTLRDVAPEDKAKVGAEINKIKTQVETMVNEAEVVLKDKELNEKLLNEKIDVTLDKKESHIGVIHPLTRGIMRITEYLTQLGFQQIDLPEVELDKYCFENLNVPKGHPVRDMQDTFYLSEDIVLRTQTTTVQSRAMEYTKPPFKLFGFGRVFRIDEVDATHSPAFSQVDAVYVDKKVSMADLKNTLTQLLKAMFGEGTNVRFRASFFPFTEPSVEVDATCPFCKGVGCSVCKKTGWIELLGGGMVHPNVLEKAGIDSNEYSGFAFGIGMDRIVQTEAKIHDIRLLLEHDIRFLDEWK